MAHCRQTRKTSRLCKLVFLYILMSVLGCLCSSRLLAQEPPLVDGNCEEYSRLRAKKVAISNEIDLYLYQDKYYVWLCYTYPDGSFATADLTLKTHALPSRLNLHVSAQLGEWPADKPELAPKDAESDQWWNARGWTANTVWINGMDRSGDTPRYRFKNAKAREMQLSKRRFGKGNWLLKLEVRRVKGPDGKFYDAVFPKTAESYVLKVF
jgi:hypothetical protein